MIPSESHVCGFFFFLHMAGAQNKFAKFLLSCLKCCFWCLEKFIKFLNRNAYIMVSLSPHACMYGCVHSFTKIPRLAKSDALNYRLLQSVWPCFLKKCMPLWIKSSAKYINIDEDSRNDNRVLALDGDIRKKLLHICPWCLLSPDEEHYQVRWKRQ